MKLKLRDDWYRLAIDPAISMSEAGIYQWSIEGVGVYVGKAKVLRERLRAYPRNVLAMIEGRSWHGNPVREYRDIHKALHAAYEAGTLVTVTILEVCDPAVRAERERYWIGLRYHEAAQGGPPVLNFQAKHGQNTYPLSRRGKRDMAHLPSLKAPPPHP